MVNDLERHMLETLVELKTTFQHSVDTLDTLHTQMHAYFTALDESRDRDVVVNNTAEAKPSQISQHSTTVAKTALGLILLVAMGFALGYALKAAGRPAMAKETKPRPTNPPFQMQAVADRYGKLIEKHPNAIIVPHADLSRERREDLVSSKLMLHLNQVNHAFRHLPAAELKELLNRQGG